VPPFFLFVSGDQARLRGQPGEIGRLIRDHQPIDQSAGTRQFRITVDHDQGCFHYAVSASTPLHSAWLRAAPTLLAADRAHSHLQLDKDVRIECRPHRSYSSSRVHVPISVTGWFSSWRSNSRLAASRTGSSAAASSVNGFSRAMGWPCGRYDIAAAFAHSAQQPGKASIGLSGRNGLFDCHSPTGIAYAATLLDKRERADELSETPPLRRGQANCGARTACTRPHSAGFLPRVIKSPWTYSVIENRGHLEPDQMAHLYLRVIVRDPEGAQLPVLKCPFGAKCS